MSSYIIFLKSSSTVSFPANERGVWKMDNFEEDDDAHYCIKCHMGISGLDNYVRHRQSGCRPSEEVKAHEIVREAAATPPAVTYPEILNADAFFSSLELQSSAKPPRPRESTKASEKSRRWFCNFQKSKKYNEQFNFLSNSDRLAGSAKHGKIWTTAAAKVNSITKSKYCRLSWIPIWTTVWPITCPFLLLLASLKLWPAHQSPVKPRLSSLPSRPHRPVAWNLTSTRTTVTRVNRQWPVWTPLWHLPGTLRERGSSLELQGQLIFFCWTV